MNQIKLAADCLVYTQEFPAIRYIFHTYYYVSGQDDFSTQLVVDSLYSI
nr:MAG TPA: hypothetical protein [Caudoviricetes sp.]